MSQPRRMVYGFILCGIRSPNGIYTEPHDDGDDHHQDSGGGPSVER